MVKRVFISGFLLLLPVSAFAADQGLLPAICQQVLAPSKDTSVAEVVKDYVAKKAAELPQALANDAVSIADAAAGSVAEKIESYKKPLVLPSKSGAAAASGSGTATVFDGLFNNVLDGSAFLARHWPWTLGGAGAGAALLFFL